jgi:aminoacyl tRNA synthase complex-interacting multifunctional protein 1
MSDFLTTFDKLSIHDVSSVDESKFAPLNNEQSALAAQFTTLSSRFGSEEQAIVDLNDNLRSKTFVTGPVIAKVDFIVFGSIFDIASKWTSVDDLGKFRHIIRWIDLLQTKYVKVDTPLKIDHSVQLPREIKEKKKPAAGGDGKGKEKDNNGKKTEKQAPAGGAGGAAAGPLSEEEKKAKAEAAKAKKAARAKAKAEANAKNQTAVVPPNPGMVDFRVGFIEKAIKHPDADALYVSTIQMGDEDGPRTVCSGLVKHYALEDMQQRYVIVLANLKPVTMRGIKSSAMVLCAASEDKVEFVNPPPNSKPGDKLFFEDYNSVPEKQLNPKKKIFEAVQPKFSTNDKFEVTYTEEGQPPKRLVNEKGELCHSSTIVNADVR